MSIKLKLLKRKTTTMEEEKIKFGLVPSRVMLTQLMYSGNLTGFWQH